MERTTEMKLLHALVVTGAACLALALDASTAQAAGPGCNGPFCNQPKYPTFGSYLSNHPAFSGFQKPKLPAFQAAPWYMYWPYDAHFLTPAPITGPFYGPPVHGNFPVNPYFPAPVGAAGYGFGYGFSGGIPGGPPPMGYPLPHPGPGGR
ncbi:MAG: hypothetical protein L0241_12370 [Planctomycetia bacterium]|nr:hypothetical protein [Planctomycetia bacterium]